MAAAMYIVVEGEDPEFDTFVNGRALARQEDALEKLALRLDVAPLIDFFSADEALMSLLVEEGGGDVSNVPPLMPTQWFAGRAGLQTVEALLIELESEPQLLGSETSAVVGELREYATVLRKTDERGLRFHLAVSFR